MEAENGREFNPAPSKQVLHAFAFSFFFERKSLCGLGDHAQRVTNKFLIFLSFILLFEVKSLCALRDLCGKLVFPWII
jgi:hypothetical protein